jgi:hypothetical protein
MFQEMAAYINREKIILSLVSLQFVSTYIINL